MEPEINNQSDEMAAQKESSIDPLYKNTTLSKYFALAVFIVLPFLGAWVGYSLAPEGEGMETKVITVIPTHVKKEAAVTTSKDVVDVSKVVTVASTSKTVIAYVDSDIGIRFSYPKDWGEVSIVDEMGTCPISYVADPCNARTYYFSKLGSTAAFMTAVTAGYAKYVPERNKELWGDAAINITQDNIKLCIQSGECDLLPSVNGITFTRLPQESLGLKTSYQLYNNYGGAYYGFILSPEQIKNISSDSDSAIDIAFMEVVLQSFELLTRY